MTEKRNELRLETWPTERLVPFARNARTHSKKQVGEIAGSIRAFGFANPILVGPEGDIVAGHGPLAAAQLLGLEQVPVIVISGLTEMERRQLVLADNRIALNAGWNAEMLRAELKDLSALGAHLAALGFTKSELARAVSTTRSGLTDEDSTPEVCARIVSRAGDIWCLGAHRIVCGDSTEPQTIRVLLKETRPGLMVTDPPYGVDYDPEWRHQAGINSSKRTGRVLNDGRADWGAVWANFAGEIAYVWHGALHATTVADSLERHGFQIRAQIIWAKERLVIGRGDYHWQHEPCWYAVRTKGNWTGDRKQTTLWSISSGNQDVATVHGTQKPVECMRRPIQNNTSPGDAVFDPFLGSGTTLIAAETLGRVCLGVELNPQYVDVVIRRWQAFTGSKATLQANGRSFDEIESERVKVVNPEKGFDQ